MAREDAEIRLLIAALDAEGSDRCSQAASAALVDRIFDASVIELRRGLAGAVEIVPARPALRLVGESIALTERRRLSWRRLAPLAAMAASIALAPLVAVPVLGPALGPALASNQVDDVVPVALMEPGTPLEPVLAALLQQDADGSWSGVPMPAIDISMLQPGAGRSGGASFAEMAPMIPILEAHQSEFSDFAAEFARIREAATRAPTRASGRSSSRS